MGRLQKTHGQTEDDTERERLTKEKKEKREGYPSTSKRGRSEGRVNEIHTRVWMNDLLTLSIHPVRVTGLNPDHPQLHPSDKSIEIKEKEEGRNGRKRLIDGRKLLLVKWMLHKREEEERSQQKS